MKTIITMIQSKFGNLFFLPKSCIPGYHNYFIAIAKVPKEKLEEECVMCYTALKQAVEEQFSEQPNVGSPEAVLRHSEGTTFKDCEAEGNNGTESLFQKAKRCAVTPCNHYFHVSCFKHWIKVKHECPICRTQLKFYLE